MTALFRRAAEPPTAARARGCWVYDSDGNPYLDAASGALVVNLGHGDTVVVAAARDQLETMSYVHASAFTSEVSERYASELSARLPMDHARIYPVSGGAEAVETALKAARTYHLAREEPERSVVIGRELSYHGNTRGALDVSGRVGSRAPYLPWLGQSGRVPGILEYRCPNPAHPSRCAAWHAGALSDEIERIGAGRVAAFIAEPVGGAASGAALPPDGYWPAIVEVCRRHGVLVIADEVMTGFGRTGEWFASELFGLVPDLMTLAKGASSGYWPLGACAMSAGVATVLEDAGFTHGFTNSHHPVGAAVGLAVMQRIDQLALVDAARVGGPVLRDRLTQTIGGHPHVGDIRGVGFMLGVELVADKSTKEPFPLRAGVAPALARAARDQGLLVYPSTGCAGGGRGDVVMVGPPLAIDEEEMGLIVSLLEKAMGRLTWP